MYAQNTALIIAALSLVLASLSLGWQIAQWLLSAGRPRATLMHGMKDGAGAYVGPVKKGGTPFDLDSLHKQGINGPEVVGIQVTNHGRAPVSVDSLSLRPRGGVMSFVPVDDSLGPGLPFRLDAGTRASWYVTADNAARLVGTSREVLKERISGVYMTAHLGTGKKVETPQTLRM